MMVAPCVYLLPRAKYLKSEEQRNALHCNITLASRVFWLGGYEIKMHANHHLFSTHPLLLFSLSSTDTGFSRASGT